MNHVKYPRTCHLPWSNPSKDDKIIKSLDNFKGKEVVVTLKMDGENFTGYSDYCHARSLEPLFGEDRGIAKSIWASIAHEIPIGWRFCAENMYAKHSIEYEDLESYLLVFSFWDDQNICLSWDDTIEYCRLLNLHTVPVIYRGIWDEKEIQKIFEENYDEETNEGYVVRLSSEFSFDDFKNCVAKYVRKNHVQPNIKHWRSAKIVPNKLKTRDN